jgi:hypothetical protein
MFFFFCPRILAFDLNECFTIFSENRTCLDDPELPEASKSLSEPEKQESLFKLSPDPSKLSKDSSGFSDIDLNNVRSLDFFKIPLMGSPHSEKDLPLNVGGGLGGSASDSWLSFAEDVRGSPLPSSALSGLLALEELPDDASIIPSWFVITDNGKSIVSASLFCKTILA